MPGSLISHHAALSTERIIHDRRATTMLHWTPFNEEDIDEEREEEPRELPEVKLDAPGACCICGKPDCERGCFKCGRPVCYHSEDYLADSDCGGWILDSWHP